MPTIGLLKVFVVFSSVVLLSACQPAAESLWQDYLQRLERLTEQTMPTADATALQRYPRPRDLRQPVPELRTGLRRYFNLSDCDMMNMVSERNSSLGRVQVPSLRFAYELEFINRSSDCLADDRLADNEDQQAWLADINRLKRESLPALYWNATVASDEMASFFTTTAQAPTSEELAGRSALSVHLASVARLGAQLQSDPLPKGVGTLESDLAQLSRANTGGSILKGLALAERDLRRAAIMLEQVDTERLCPRQRPGQQARYLQNVFISIYGERVQPWLAQLYRASDELSQSVQQLYDHWDVDSPAFDAWYAHHFDQQQGLSALFQEAMMRHTQAWQQLLEACRLQPGSGAGQVQLNDRD